MISKVIDIADRAGEIILSYYGSNMTVKEKDDKSPLTQADLKANALIVDELGMLSPDTPIVSEEGDVPEYQKRRTWKRFWLVDPLDGTKEFLKHNGEFTVNIAFIEDRVPTLGVVYAPALKLMYYADKTSGAWMRRGADKPSRIYVRQPLDHEKLVIMESRSHADKGLLDKRFSKIPHERITLGSSLKFCYVAEGRAHVYPRFGPTMEWDVAAGDCVFRYASSGQPNASPLTYNKQNLKNDNFIIGYMPD